VAAEQTFIRNVCIPPDRQDNELARRIINNELPGIFNWALEGLLRLQSRGRFVEPAECRLIKEAHRVTCSPELEFFNEFVAEGAAGDFVPISEIYLAYRTVAQSNGNSPMAMRKFVETLKRRYPNCREERRMANGKQVRGYSRIIFAPNGLATIEGAE